MQKNWITKAVLSLGIMTLSTSAFAAGFQLSEFSAVNLGRAFNGAGISGDDYSAIAFNPAGMSLKKSGAQAGMTLVMIKADVKGSTRNGLTHTGKEGDIRLRNWIPHFFAQYQLNDKFDFGLGMYAPFGLSTVYNNSWFGRTHALKSKITAMDITPSVSYKVMNGLTLGGSFIAERVDAKLTNALPAPFGGKNEVKGDDWSYGYTVGIMYEPIQDTRFGVSYRSKISHQLKGKHIVRDSMGGMGPIPAVFVNGTTPGRAKLTLPEHVLFSAYQKIDKFGLSASAKWTRWSRFERLDIYSDNMLNGVSSTEEKWENVWMLGAGLDYYHDDNWTFRLGVAYDESPVKGAEYRTARIPDNNRWWTSVGVSYKYKQATIDLGYSHMFVKAAKTRHVTAGSCLDAKYEMQANLIGLQVQYEF